MKFILLTHMLFILSVGCTDLDISRLILSENNRGREKPNPAARHKMTVAFAAKKMRPRFGLGMHRRGQGEASMRVLLNRYWPHVSVQLNLLNTVHYIWT
jgi:hypothetical protein